MAIEALLDAFLSYARVERGLSRNTVESYGRDLTSFGQFLDSAKIRDFETVDLGVVSEWLQSLARRGLSPRSAARHLSALRGLMRFLVQENEVRRDPTRLAARPRLGRQRMLTDYRAVTHDLLRREEVAA